MFIANTSGLLCARSRFDYTNDLRRIKKLGDQGTQPNDEFSLGNKVEVESTNLDNSLIEVKVEEKEELIEGEVIESTTSIDEENVEDLESHIVFNNDDDEGEGEEERGESMGLLSTEELNKKFDEFIRKMKEELRIQGQQQLIMV